MHFHFCFETTAVLPSTLDSSKVMVGFLVKMTEILLMMMLEQIMIKPKLGKYLEKPLKAKLVIEYQLLLSLCWWGCCHFLTEIGESVR